MWPPARVTVPTPLGLVSHTGSFLSPQGAGVLTWRGGSRGPTPRTGPHLHDLGTSQTPRLPGPPHWGSGCPLLSFWGHGHSEPGTGRNRLRFPSSTSRRPRWKPCCLFTAQLETMTTESARKRHGSGEGKTSPETLPVSTKAARAEGLVGASVTSGGLRGTGALEAGLAGHRTAGQNSAPVRQGRGVGRGSRKASPSLGEGSVRRANVTQTPKGHPVKRVPRPAKWERVNWGCCKAPTLPARPGNADSGRRHGAPPGEASSRGTCRPTETPLQGRKAGNRGARSEPSKRPEGRGRPSRRGSSKGQRGTKTGKRRNENRLCLGHAWTPGPH